MDQETARSLLELNRRFYADFGEQFSVTRQRIQPGVRKVISGLHGGEHILDLGCGNGELARVLAGTNFFGTYTGMDFSHPMLSEAQSSPKDPRTSFINADLTSPGWERLFEPGSFSLITSFAVLHHIPGMAMRREIIERIRCLLEPGGKFIHSNWQFLNSEKFRAHIQPWQIAGLSQEDVDEGDYLLDWRSGGTGLRYVHHFSRQELEQLATLTGFRVVDSFISDGEGGKLGLYQTWEINENKR